MKKEVDVRKQGLHEYIRSHNFGLISTLFTYLFILILFNCLVNYSVFNLISTVISFVITISFWEVYLRILYNDMHIFSGVTRLSYSFKLVALYMLILVFYINILVISDKLDFMDLTVFLIYVIIIFSLITLVLTSITISNLSTKEYIPKIYDATVVFLGITGVIYLVIFVGLLLTYASIFEVEFLESFLDKSTYAPIYIFLLSSTIMLICIYSSISLNSYLKKSRYNINSIIEKYSKR